MTGDYACFTRPECKVERVSYPFITPSAARGIFDAIYWHPPIRWMVTRIEILSPVRWTNIMRNEVAARASERVGHLYIDDHRQQKSARILKDVAYRLHAQMLAHPVPEWGPNAVIDIMKYETMFERRASRGQFFNYPYLGCREFSVKSLRLITNPGEAAKMRPACRQKIEAGFMLYDTDFDDKDHRPMLFCPQVVNGVVNIPDIDSKEVWR